MTEAYCESRWRKDLRTVWGNETLKNIRRYFIAIVITGYLGCAIAGDGNVCNADVSLSGSKLSNNNNELNACSANSLGQCIQTMCGNCKDTATCISFSGLCPGKKCKAGWRGPQCMQKCPAGTYGEDCGQQCGHCDGGSTCDHVYGECTGNLCAAGWTGKLCDEVCGHQKYGANCSRTCHCYTHFTCDPVNGSCGSHGCTIGWTGDQCSTPFKCERGFWAKDCRECGACITPCQHPPCRDYCDPFTGLCPHGCQPNFMGERCDLCVGRKYGVRCEKECGHCYNGYLCHMRTGICEFNTCEAGYMGTKCDLECRQGRYGYECGKRCSVNCRYGHTCHFINGTCLSGCKAGWTGHSCHTPIECSNLTSPLINLTRCAYLFPPPLKEPCPVGWFGEECESRCGHCRYRKICHTVTGACPNGCATHFTGHYCTIRKGVIIPLGN